MVHCLAVPIRLVILDGSFYGLLNRLVAFSVLLLRGLRGLSGRLADGGWTALPRLGDLELEGPASAWELSQSAATA